MMTTNRILFTVQNCRPTSAKLSHSKSIRCRSLRKFVADYQFLSLSMIQLRTLRHFAATVTGLQIKIQYHHLQFERKVSFHVELRESALYLQCFFLLRTVHHGTTQSCVATPDFGMHVQSSFDGQHCSATAKPSNYHTGFHLYGRRLSCQFLVWV